MIETSYQCAYCGEPNDLIVDPSAGVRQQYVEDCQVCCRPNSLTILVKDDEAVEVTAEQES